MMASPVSRRRFLQSGSVCLALPWLESLAAAGEMAPLQRMVCICTDFGLYGPAFFPKAAGKDYEPSEYLSILGDLRDRFTVFSGISHPEIGGDHASATSFLTGAKHVTKGGFRNTVSLDFLAAQHVGAATRFPLLALSTANGSPLTHTPSGAGIPAMDRPSVLFAKLFLAGKPAEVQKEMQRLRYGRSVLDRMADRFGELRRTLNVADQRQVNDYADAVRALEKQLVADEDWTQRPKPTVDMQPPNEAYPSPFADPCDIVGRARVMLDLARLALQTDSTRVVSLFIRGAECKTPIEGVAEAHHRLTHHGQNPEIIEQLKLVESKEMEVFRDFLAGLRDDRVGAESLLDTTQVLIGSNLGDASSHNTSNLPILLAGGSHRHGRHIAGDNRNNNELGKVFVSMLQQFGVETDSFGHSRGTLSELAS
jgi:hypothetical protein